MMVTAMDGLIVEFRCIENAVDFAQLTDTEWYLIPEMRRAFFAAVVRLALVDLDDTRSGMRTADVIRAGWEWHKRAAELGEHSEEFRHNEILSGMRMLIEALRKARWLTDREAKRYIALLVVFSRNSAKLEALIEEIEADRAAGRFVSLRDIHNSVRDMFWRDISAGRSVRSAVRAAAYWLARADGGDMSVQKRSARAESLAGFLCYARDLGVVSRPVMLRYTRLLSVLSAYAEMDHFFLAW